MVQGWRVAAACLIALFGFTLVMSLEYSLFDDLGPGSDFFPFWLSVVGLALSALLLAQTFGRSPAGAETANAQDAQEPAAVLPDRDAVRRLVPIVLALVAVSLLLEPLGFRLTMLLFIACLLAALGARSAVAVGAMAVLGSFGVFHVFYYWLKVPLPIGSLGI